MLIESLPFGQLRMPLAPVRKGAGQVKNSAQLANAHRRQGQLL